MIKKRLVINGLPRTLLVNPDDTLAKVLREQLLLTGCKIGCNQGQCGTCTVIVDGKAVRSCIMKMGKIKDDTVIETIEGIGSVDNLHPLQVAWMGHGCAQCGFCSPGFIMSAKVLLEENPSLQNYSLEELLTMWCRLPCHLQASLKNNAGGVYNHRFYFDGMNPGSQSDCASKGRTVSSSRLFLEMTRQFGSPENFRSQFKTAALSVFGSGYAWLVSDSAVLKIVTSSNQNTPVRQFRTLLLNIDVWEHAYYLKHYNLRAAYIDDWFHVVNWEKAAERFAAGHPDCRCR